MALVLYGASGDLRSELGNPSEAEYSADDIARARTRATNTINVFVEKAYPGQVPFASSDIPELIQTLASDLGVYYARRSKYQGPAPLTDEIKVEYYDKSIKILELIRDGELEIPELESKRGETILAPQSGYVPTFDEDEIEKSVIDDDKIEDIGDSK